MPKKTKAIKRTDIKSQKPWLRKAKPSIPEIEIRELNRTILIVGEGQSEKLYFESFPVITLTVKAIDLGGQSKRKLIEATDKIVKESENKYDEVWCVFDMDIKKGEKEFSDFDNAINSGKAKGYHVAYSNDSFELWYYLHYHFTDQSNRRQFYYKALSQFWNCNYEKVGKSYEFCLKTYELLQKDKNASQVEAIKRAQTLYNNQSHKEYHKQNPVTLLFELVIFLNQNLRR